MKDSARRGVQLSPTQLAWLQEIGLDRRLLRQFTGRPSAPPAVPAPARPGEASGQGGLRRAAELLAGRENLHEAGSAMPGAIAGQRTPVATLKTPAGPQPAMPAAPVVQHLPAEWSALQEHVAACVSCTLHTGRSQTVFGAGATESVGWMVIGEAPGDRDDRTGLPFQGKAGKLLHAMLEAAGVGPEAPVFYTNLIKCRPPGNRNPVPAEITACRPYLLRQIAMLKPQRILVLGWLAAQSLLTQPGNLEQLRGRVHWLELDAAGRIPVVATYHPASLLARAQHKANAWRDLLLARSV